MTDRNTIINAIQDLLGDGGSREIAEEVFELLRVDNRIYWNDSLGLVIRDDVSLFDVAAELE